MLVFLLFESSSMMLWLGLKFLCLRWISVFISIMVVVFMLVVLWL